VGALVASGVFAAPVLANPLGEVALFSSGISNDHGGPEQITTGLEGNLWFTESGQYGSTSEDIGRLEPSTGQITEFSNGITPERPAEDIATGPEGDLWFTQFYGEQVGRLNPLTGVVTEFPVYNSPDRDSGIIAGPDGGIWFTQGYSDRIGRIDPKTGVLTEYSNGISGSPGRGTSGPFRLAWGPEGDLWFTQDVTGEIGRLNPSTGQITEFTPGDIGPETIVAGSDGNLWFDGNNGDRHELGRLNPTTGQVTTYLLSADGFGRALAAGPEGDIWFSTTVTGGSVIGRIIPPSGHIEEFPKQTAYAAVSLVSGPGNNIWFATTQAAIGSIGTEDGAAPAVTTQPVSSTVTAPTAATFTVACSGVNTPTVQWEESTNGTTWAAIAGATSSTLSLSPTSLSESGTEYRATCTNVEGQVKSTAAPLTVYTKPIVDSNPASTTVTPGETATFSSTAHGTPTPTVQWEVSSNHGLTWSPIPGATEGTIQVSGVTFAQNETEYQAVWTSGGGTTDSQAATLTVSTAPVIEVSPTSVTVAEGDSAAFTSAASGSPAPTVQWETSTNHGASWAQVPGATASTLTVASVTLNETGTEYRAVWTNVAQSVPSTAATLTVDAPPTITTSAVSAITATSATLTGTVNPNGSDVSICEVHYGTTGAGPEHDECISLPGSGYNPESVSSSVTGLSPDTTYEYQLTATNGIGENSGTVAAFTTLANSSTGTSGSASGAATANIGTALEGTALGGPGTITVGQYGSDPVTAKPPRAGTNYFDVYLQGNGFSRLEFTDCELDGASAIEWYNPTTGQYEAVSEETTPPTGSPPCITVTVNNSTSPDLAQMTGTVFVGVVAAGPKPTLKKLSAKKGTTAGGTAVTITGTGFAGIWEVKFGSKAATRVTYHSNTSITAISPPASGGKVDVTVTTPNGTSAASSKYAFTYKAPKKKK
jgi:streptogramin lyase